MKKTKHSLIINNHLDSLNELAEFLLKELKVDVRFNTKSRANDLPKYRSVFFNIYLSCYKIDYASLGSYLDKDHASINHAIKMWNNYLAKDFMYLLTKFKIQKNLITETEQNILDKDTLIKKLQNTIALNQIKYLELKQNATENFKNPTLKELLLLDEETINFVCETRLKPFLKMHKNKVTNEDLIKKKHETRTM